MKRYIWLLYEYMLRSRLFEEAVTRIWHDGRISGEMHLRIGCQGAGIWLPGKICQSLYREYYSLQPQHGRPGAARDR